MSRNSLLLVAAVVVVFVAVGGVLIIRGQGGGGRAVPYTVTVTNGAQMSPDHLTARQGDTVTIALKSDREGEVHLHGYDIHFETRAGETVTLDGQVVKFRAGALDWKPSHVPPLYIASRGPQILKLAGEIADGVLIGSFSTVPGIEYAKQQILPGLELAKRSWRDIRMCSWIYVSVLDHADEAGLRPCSIETCAWRRERAY